jgi:hypothetical protein
LGDIFVLVVCGDFFGRQMAVKIIKGHFLSVLVIETLGRLVG